MHILAGPRVDSLRVGLFSPDTVCDDARGLLTDARQRALLMRSKPHLNSCDIATRWPGPGEQLAAAPIDWTDESTGETFSVFVTGEIQALPKIANSPILADLTTGDDGPGWLRIRAGEASRKYPYAVVLDLRSEWLWRHASPLLATRMAVKYWIDSGVLDYRADIALNSPKWHRVTRCDIAVDHIPREDWAPESYRFFATRSKEVGFEAGPPKLKSSPDTPPARCVFGPRSFTLYLGKRGGAGPMWRIYLKTAQLAATAPKEGGSPWFWNPITDIWTAAGWNRKADVWRAEVEIPARMLQQLDGGDARMSCLQALDIEALWGHCTEVTRHTDSDMGRGSRRKTSKTWQMLQNATAKHRIIGRVPAVPVIQKPDFAAIREAVASAVVHGALSVELSNAVHDGMIRGQRRQVERDQRLEKIHKIEARMGEQARASDDL